MPENPHAHIPPHIEQAMNQHMQQSMPAHLKKYVSGDHSTYVPQHAQQQISQYMETSMPTHLKQYAGAYMEQRVVQPNSTHPNITLSSNLGLPNPHVPSDQLHNANLYAEQQGIPQLDNPASLPPVQSQPVQPTPPPTPELQPAHPSNYEFIMNPDAPKKPKLSLPGSSSLLGRVVLIGGGLVVLLVLFSVVKGLLGESSTSPALVSVAQDQQQLIHLATNATKQRGLSTTNKNFALNAQLSLGTEQPQLLNYMKKNGKKINGKQLNFKLSSAIDKQLTEAAATNTYDQTFKEIMQTKLTTYQHDLKQAYSQTKGPKGRSLLDKDYKAAQLLTTQLNATAN